MCPQKKLFLYKFISLFFMLGVGVSFCSAQQTKFFRTYSMGVFDVGEVVIPINDTNYIVAGTTNTAGPNGTDMLLFQTNSVGDVTWWKNIGGTGIENAKGAVMAVDSSGYYLTGLKNVLDSSGYNVWVVKTDLTGDTVWTRTYGGTNWEMSSSINKLSDSTYIVAGETYSFGNGQKDMYLLHINAAGDTLWTRTFGGPSNDIAKYVLVDRYDNILVVGNTESFGAGYSDVYLVYMDINGDTIWTKTIGTSDDDFGYSADMYIDTSNTMGFVIGYTSYYAPDLAQNSYMLRIDSLGNSIALFPLLESNAIILDHIKLRSSSPGKVFYTTDIKYAYDEISIIYAQKTDYGLVPGTQITFASGGNESTMPNDIYRTLDGGYIITGFSENWGPGPTSCILLKTDSVLSAPDTPTVSIATLDGISMDIFPNPVVGGYFYINSSSYLESVKIYNLTGQLVQAFTTSSQVKSLTLEKPQVSSGIYMVEIKTSAGTVCKKIIF